MFLSRNWKIDLYFTLCEGMEQWVIVSIIEVRMMDDNFDDNNSIGGAQIERGPKSVST